MRYVVYGLRRRGEPEMRYIGRTAKPLEKRLYNHVYEVRLRPKLSSLYQWVRDCGDDIEIIPLAEHTDWGAVKDAEREMIRLCLAMGHRLFNQWLVPADQRLPQSFVDRLAA